MTPVAEYSFTAKNGKCTIENIELNRNCDVVIWVDELPEGYNGKMHIKLDKENDYSDNYIAVALDNVPEEYQQSYIKKNQNRLSSFSESILIQGIYIWDLIHNKIKQECNAVEFDPIYANEYNYKMYYNPFDINMTLFICCLLKWKLT